ncbi:MAG TPA: protein-glutamate O-methyltransferase CheR [Gammaproteobacteria bacterium]|nr:protein-glutamate O-methyltransferase CheR [Gammaproteobacteria bacterium]
MDLALKAIDHKNYTDFANYLESVSGIALSLGKEYLLEMRLRPLFRQLNIHSMQDMITRAKSDRRVLALMIDALTTNETSWFRDRYPFSHLQKIIFPALIKQGASRINCWSAACSSGQEPYSIAMVFEEMRRNFPCTTSLNILATEISDSMLEEAKKGCYSERAIARGLSEDLKNRYLQPCSNSWQVVPKVRQGIRFQKFNLVHGQELASLGQFDVIFCRNVLIYFTTQVKTRVLTRLASSLKTGGYLMLGSSEYVSLDLPYFITEKLSPGFVFRRTAVPVKR